MKWRSVESSNVLRWGYNSRRRALAITFHSGSVYVYTQVPAMVAWGMEQAPSKGKFTNQIIKKYPYRRIV